MPEEMLRNREQIMRYLGVGKRRFYSFLKMDPPMPAKKVGNAYEAYAEDLLDWKRRYLKSAS